jgi:transcriptional regulator with XRE-family HTH domain
MTKPELKRLRKKLPKTASKDLAVQFNMRQQSINSILNGTRFNEDVLDAAINMADQYQKLLKKKSKIIKAL